MILAMIFEIRNTLELFLDLSLAKQFYKDESSGLMPAAFRKKITKPLMGAAFFSACFSPVDEVISGYQEEYGSRQNNIHGMESILFGNEP